MNENLWSWVAIGATVLNAVSIALNVSSRRRYNAMWERRSDDARRTKGDPPLTYAQLEAKAQAFLESGENLRKRCDNLIAENARLRTVVGEKTEYVEELAADLGRARSHGICGDEPPTVFGSASGTTCLLRHGHASQWHEGQSGERWKHTEPDVTRPYIPKWDGDFAGNPAGYPAGENPWDGSS